MNINTNQDNTMFIHDINMILYFDSSVITLNNQNVTEVYCNDRLVCKIGHRFFHTYLEFIGDNFSIIFTENKVTFKDINSENSVDFFRNMNVITLYEEQFKYFKSFKTLVDGMEKNYEYVKHKSYEFLFMIPQVQVNAFKLNDFKQGNVIQKMFEDHSKQQKHHDVYFLKCLEALLLNPLQYDPVHRQFTIKYSKSFCIKLEPSYIELRNFQRTLIIRNMPEYYIEENQNVFNIKYKEQMLMTINKLTGVLLCFDGFITLYPCYLCVNTEHTIHYKLYCKCNQIDWQQLDFLQDRTQHRNYFIQFFSSDLNENDATNYIKCISLNKDSFDGIENKLTEFFNFYDQNLNEEDCDRIKKFITSFDENKSWLSRYKNFIILLILLILIGYLICHNFYHPYDNETLHIKDNDHSV
jgi:hypothetical protein